MKKEFNNIIDKVEKEIADASIHFELFLRLFGSQENLRAINQSAPNVFMCFRQSLIDTTVIKLCRLLDPAEKGRNRNIGIHMLVENFEGETEFQEHLRQKAHEIEAHVEELKPYRHKRLAHNDFRTHTESRHDVIGNKHIDSAINALQEFVNLIRIKKYGHEVHILNQGYPLKDGPDRLIRLLKKGIDANQSELKNA